jgi:hypothetical protein
MTADEIQKLSNPKKKFDVFTEQKFQFKLFWIMTSFSLCFVEVLYCDGEDLKHC